ncbi:Mss4-like protein [Gymnopilus junonius]|uniref:Mss4-like protein n=1 Tax=Gymnopilus junonius TaxID=109634 RepID=A0A9P5NEW2_GYMJU|nr:Mss4-like protein [Gymnopilus junonius]
MPEMSSTFVKASCKCGLNTFQIPFDTVKLPLTRSFCHCNSCRHITGQLMFQGAMFDGVPLTTDSTSSSRKPADLSNLKTYKGDGSLFTRYFCKACGAHIVGSAEIDSVAYWAVSTGALERVDGIVKAGSHTFVSDTLDGGLAEHYRIVDGVTLPRYTTKKNSATLHVGWSADSIGKKVKAGGGQDHLAAYCHCKAISLRLTRVEEELTKDPMNWWAVAKKADEATSLPKFMCGHCLCNSCRLTSGTIINSWVILPAVNVLNSYTGNPVTYSPGSSGRIAGLQLYESSPGVFREACGTCGATIFLWYTKKGHYPMPIDGEPVVVCVSAGLIDQEDGGTRAEQWCHWHEEVIHPEDAIDKAGLEALKKGVKTAPTQAD